MSNFRLFCFAFWFIQLLTVIAEWAGYEGSYTGVEKLLAQVLIGIIWAASTVAIMGDRKSAK